MATSFSSAELTLPGYIGSPCAHSIYPVYGYNAGNGLYLWYAPSPPHALAKWYVSASVGVPARLVAPGPAISSLSLAPETYNGGPVYRFGSGLLHYSVWCSVYDGYVIRDNPPGCYVDKLFAWEGWNCVRALYEDLGTWIKGGASPFGTYTLGASTFIVEERPVAGWWSNTMIGEYTAVPGGGMAGSKYVGQIRKFKTTYTNGPGGSGDMWFYEAGRCSGSPLFSGQDLLGATWYIYRLGLNWFLSGYKELCSAPAVPVLTKGAGGAEDPFGSYASCAVTPSTFLDGVATTGGFVWENKAAVETDMLLGQVFMANSDGANPSVLT
jgi:hypothetical protein